MRSGGWIVFLLISKSLLFAETMSPVNFSPEPGIVITNASFWRDTAYGNAIAADGTVLVAASIQNVNRANFGVIKYTATGELDRSFGDQGKFTIDFGTGDSKALAVAVQKDGKIVAVGNGNNGQRPVFAVVKLSADGKVDTSFGLDGKVLIPMGIGESDAYAVALQEDGKIIVVGSALGDEGLKFAVVRLDGFGNLDYSFGGEGKLLVSFGAKFDAHGYSIVLQKDGRMVIAGFTVQGKKSWMAVARLKTDGSLDSSFGQNGLRQLSLKGYENDSAYAVVLQPDQKILLAGNSSNGRNLTFAVARLNRDGSSDKSFGDDGSTLQSIGAISDIAYGMALQKNGKILLVGGSYDVADFDVAVARFNSDGNPDLTFGKQGVSINRLSAQYDVAYCVAIQNDDKIVAAGVAFREKRYSIAVLRYTDQGKLDDSFNAAPALNQIARGVQDNAISADMSLILPEGFLSIPKR
jgi:uncharacterized delta-60 repeat protein